MVDCYEQGLPRTSTSRTHLYPLPMLETAETDVNIADVFTVSFVPFFVQYYGLFLTDLMLP